MTQNIFSLTKREQRAIITIVLALLIGTLAAHFHTLRTEPPNPAVRSASPPPEEEQEPTR